MTPAVRPAILCCAAVLVLGCAGPASAQSWEVEAHGGVSVPTNSSRGNGSLPGTDAGSAATVASWYFGDGATALNQALASFGFNLQVSPLDGALQNLFFRRPTGAVIGVRVTRAVSPRFGVELSFDDVPAAFEMTPASQAAISAARSSFDAAWNTLLAAPSQGRQSVTSATSVTRGYQLIATGAVIVNLARNSRVTPFVTAGAGVLHNGAPAEQLRGSYRFQVVPLPLTSDRIGATYHETDTLTVGGSTKNGAVGVVGFGVKIAAGRRWSLRIDARDHFSANTAVTTITTTPESETSSPTGIFVLGTSPSLQFSTVSGTASTLSQSLSRGTTFRGTGIENRFSVTLGWSWRF